MPEETELDRLRRENEELKARNNKPLSMKIGEKGGLSVYGLGRFPVTLYKEQWLRLLEFGQDIKTYISANDSRLKAKD